MTDTTAPDFSTTIDIDCPPGEVFDAINQPRRWWSDSVHGETGRHGDQFAFDGADHRSWTFRVTELMPGEPRATPRPASGPPPTEKEICHAG